MYQFQTTKFMTYYRMRIVAIYNGFSIMITFSRDSIIIDLKPKPILTQNYKKKKKPQMPYTTKLNKNITRKPPSTIATVN